jgi:hypothetical protein
VRAAASTTAFELDLARVAEGTQRGADVVDRPIEQGGQWTDAQPKRMAVVAFEQHGEDGGFESHAASARRSEMISGQPAR